MLDYLVIFLVGLLGVAGGPWWVTLLGALTLSAEVLDERLKNHRVPDRHSAVAGGEGGVTCAGVLRRKLYLRLPGGALVTKSTPPKRGE
jgi:hypothetical protein